MKIVALILKKVPTLAFIGDLIDALAGLDEELKEDEPINPVSG